MHAEIAQLVGRPGAPRGSSPRAAPGRRVPPRRSAPHGGRRPHPAALDPQRRSRVDADADAHVVAVRALDRARCGDGGVGPVERGRELVAVAVDLPASGRCERGAHAAAMRLERRRIAVAELLDEPRRPLDVREQEGHAHRGESTPLLRVNGFDGLDAEAGRVRDTDDGRRPSRRPRRRRARTPRRCAVAHHDGQPVGLGVPEERDGDAVVLALCKFLFHVAILVCRGPGGECGWQASRSTADRTFQPEFVRRVQSDPGGSAESSD